MIAVVDTQSRRKINKSIDFSEEKRSSSRSNRFSQLDTEWIRRQSTMERERHQCPECPQSFTIEQNLKRHQRSQHEEVRFPCEFCGKKMSRTDVLKRHQKICGGKANSPTPDGWALLATDLKTDEADAVGADDLRSGNKNKKMKLATASEPAKKWKILSTDEDNANQCKTDAVEYVNGEHRNTNDMNGNQVKQQQDPEKSLALFCTKCGSKFTDDEDMFCRKCGTPRKSL